MLELMQKLALCYLWEELKPNVEVDDLHKWYKREKQKDPGQFFSYLVEAADKVEKFYVLKADPNDTEITILQGFEMGILVGNPALKFPFNKPSGPRAAQLGPLIKRTYSKKKGAAPKSSILKKTLEAFMKISQTKSSWSSYFAEVVDAWSRRKLLYSGDLHLCEEKQTALELAVQIIPDTKDTVFLVFEDIQGRLPGEIEEYRAYLATMIEGNKKYTTKKAPGIPISSCPLCQSHNIIAYPAACAAAGINISNMDCEGAFPGLITENAHLSYALCSDCADLLYIFKFHVLEKYLAFIAGYKALLLPDLDLNMKKIDHFIRNFKKYMDQLATKKKGISIENKLLKMLSQSNSIVTIDIIWAKFGQKIEKLSGAVTEILPSRLRQIYELSKKFEKNDHPLFPRHKLEEFRFDIDLKFLKSLFHRPGKAKSANQSKRLQTLKQLVIAALYKQKLIPYKRLWKELIVTAECYLRNVMKSEQMTFELLHEGYSSKKLTMAGWIRHLAMVLEYFRSMEVMPTMNNQCTYSPESPLLTPYFGEKSGINEDSKAFAFILGILYGKVLSAQGARGINVGANALTWLKRLTLSGKDLPDLFVKVREKLLAYEVERSSYVREVIKELAKLGCILGNDIKLGQTDCCYFLLLGQAVSTDVLPSKS